MNADKKDSVEKKKANLILTKNISSLNCEFTL